MYVSFQQRKLDNLAPNVLQDSQQVQSASMTADPRYVQEDLNIQTDHNIRSMIVLQSGRTSAKKHKDNLSKVRFCPDRYSTVCTNKTRYYTSYSRTCW